MLECGRLGVDASCGRGFTALHEAADCDAVEIMELLLAQDGILVNCQSDTGLTPLMATGSPCCMELLLAYPGIEVDHLDHFGRSALGYTAERGRLECAVLLQNGARPDLVDLDGYTAKGRAEQAKQWNMVKLLEGAMGRG
jgi:ankyrin repeat protein